MKEPLIYIVLLNWNGYKDTIECVKTLSKVKYKNFKILIVDNASANESVKVLKKELPQIKLLVNKENLGFSGGCNVGIKYALKDKADYVLLLNNDTLVDKNFLTELIKVSESDKNIGIVSPFIFYADSPKKIWSAGLNFRYKNAWPFIDENRETLDKGQFKKPLKNEYLTGCSMLIKKDVFNKIGYFKDEYFLYLEDMDFSVRATRCNLTLYSVPSSKIWHKIGQSSKGGSHKVKYFFVRNTLLFFKYNFTQKEISKYVYYYIKEYLYQFLQCLKQRDFMRAKAILIGFYHGITGKTGNITL